MSAITLPPNSKVFPASKDLVQQISIEPTPREVSGITLYNLTLNGKRPIFAVPSVWVSAPPSSYNNDGKYSMLVAIRYGSETCAFFEAIQQMLNSIVKTHAREMGIKTKGLKISELVKHSDEYKSLSVNIKLQSALDKKTFKGAFMSADGETTELDMSLKEKLYTCAIMLEVGSVWVHKSRIGVSVTARAIRRLAREADDDKSVSGESSLGDVVEVSWDELVPTAKKPRSE